jgi:multimeric flavodoxin WrbA
MQKPTRAALLVGSPRGPNSTSNSLGTYLVEKLEQKGVPYEKVYICQSLSSEAKKTALLRLVDESDLIIFAFPLYVDSLHSQVIETLELIAEHAKGKHDLDEKSVVAISNSGFPEAKQNTTALAVCRLFAKQVGFNWAGGLAMGGGEMISGQPLSELGGRVRGKTKALEIAADALAQGDPIPEKAVALMSKLGVPRWLYLLIANRRWKRKAKKTIAVKKMYDQPFKEGLKQKEVNGSC